MSSPLLECEGLVIGYASKTATSQKRMMPLNCSLQPGKITALLGRNGAGKSTLLKTWAGLQPPLAGSLHLQGQDILRLTPRQIAQSLAWVTPLRESSPGVTGWELVALGRQPHTPWHGRLGETDSHAIENALRRVKAEGFAHRPIAELSDGERQRLLLARALAQAAKVLLLDEPTAFLDRPGRSLVFRLARELAQEQGCATVISTHDLDLALNFADQILLIDAGHWHCGESQNLALRQAIAHAFEEGGDEAEKAG